MTGNSDLSRRSLWTALAASLAIHAGAGVVAARDFDAASFVPLVTPLLKVRIASEAAPHPPAPAPSPEPAPIEHVLAPAVLARAVEPTPSGRDRAPGVDLSVRSPASGAPPADVQPSAEHFAGQVRVVPDPTLQRVGSFLESRSRTDFPAEVKRPVELDEALQFEYPAEALDAHREGAVLAWLAVGPDGAVTELNIISGDDDFSVAVANALAAARFLPATDVYDKPIPFYTVLEFDFHIDRVGATGVDSASVVTVTAPPK